MQRFKTRYDEWGEVGDMMTGTEKKDQVNPTSGGWKIPLMLHHEDITIVDITFEEY